MRFNRSTLVGALCAPLGAALCLGAAQPAAAQEPLDTTELERPRVATAAGAQRLSSELLRPLRARLIGPANQSGRVTAIAVPKGGNGKTMYVAFASGGVFKTTNNGVTWQPITDDIGFNSIGDMVLAPSNPQHVWVGTGERNSLRSNGWGDGVYKSTDGGRKFARLPLAGMSHIGRIVVHPRDPDVAYVASMGHLWSTSPERGVYKTTDGGQTWERTLFVNDTVAFVDLKMDPSDPDVLYAAGWHRLRLGGGTMLGAGAGSGIWKTTNGGRSWKRLTDPALNNGLPTTNLGRIGLGVHPEDPELVYAVIQAATGATSPSVSPFGGFFRSEDGGESWMRMNDLSAVPDYYYNEVWVDPNDTEHVLLAGTYLAETKDGGRTFKNMDLGNVHVDQHAMWIDPADSDHWVLGSDGGIYITWDAGENWRHLHHAVGQFYEVNIDSTRTPYHVCGGTQDNSIWCGPSATRERYGITHADWYTLFGGDGFHSAVSPDSARYRFGEYQFGGLSRLDVETWENVPLQPHAEDAGAEAGFPFRFDWNAPFIISQHDPKTLYFGGNHLFKLLDRGRGGWEILGPDMTRGNRANPEPDTGYTSYRALHSIAESPLDARLLWTGSDDGLIWVSEDAGRSWRMRTDNIPDEAPKRCWVAEIEASRHHRQTAYVVFDCHNRGDYRPYVYRTTDLGQTWLPITGNLPQNGGSYVIREDPVNPRMLYVGTEQGLFISNVGGNDWVRFSNGLPTVAVRDMDVHPRENDLVVGTFGRSIYILEINALQELTDSVLAADAHLFKVEDARRFSTRDTYQSFGDAFFHAPNPGAGYNAQNDPPGRAPWPAGAELAYYLGRDVGRDVTLTIRRVIEGKRPEEGESVQTLRGSGRPGFHVVRWDLNARDPRPRALGEPTNPQQLRAVAPGRYAVTLNAGGVTRTRTFEVHAGWPEETYGRVR